MVVFAASYDKTSAVIVDAAPMPACVVVDSPVYLPLVDEQKLAAGRDGCARALNDHASSSFREYSLGVSWPLPSGPDYRGSV
jgi:hypothetical protein